MVVLQVRMCGGLEVHHDGRALSDALVGGRQGRLVLAFLTCERHRPVSRDELADLLWGEQLPDSWSARCPRWSPACAGCWPRPASTARRR